MNRTTLCHLLVMVASWLQKKHARNDRLNTANVQSLSHHVVEINQALRAGYRCANDIACVTAFQNPSSSNGFHPVSHNGQAVHPLQAEIVDAIRQKLRQGHHIGLKFADTRRFKAGSWQNGPTIAIAHEAQVLTQVEHFLAEHSSDYVRLLGIDPKAKQRQWEPMIQKPE